jgi:O-antigen/teichoic acid export membrane protein
MYGPKLATIREKGQLFKRSTKKMIFLAVLTYVLMGLIGPTILKAMSVNDVAEGAYVLGALNLNGLIILASTLVSPTLLSLGVKYAPIICATSALFYRPIAFMIGLKMFGTLAAACLLCSIAEATQIIITARFTCKHLSLAG